MTLPVQLPELLESDAAGERIRCIDDVLGTFGIPSSDARWRVRVGQLLSYRQGRQDQLDAARTVKRVLRQGARVPSEERSIQVINAVRSARSQHRVVLRQLRMLRVEFDKGGRRI